MRRVKVLMNGLLWMLALLAATGHTHAQDNKMLTVRPIADAPSFTKRALVIGIGNYEHAGSLAPATYNDARRFADLYGDFAESVFTHFLLRGLPGDKEAQDNPDISQVDSGKTAQQAPEHPGLQGNSGNGGNGSGPVVKTKVNPKDGAVMIFIPAGDFLMGDDDDVIKDVSTGARNNSRHKVTLSGYWIYKNVVTVGMYKKFCQAAGKQMPDAPHFNLNWSKEDHPIVNVSWDDAMAYCRWAGVHLPTEAQWEKAARGTEGLKYSFGNTFDLSKLWCSKSHMGDSGGTHRVGELGISPYGCSDMAGNVCQWCADWYDASFWSSRQAEGIDPVNQSVGEKKSRILRGGAWIFHGVLNFRASYRDWGDLDDWYIYAGFRCAAGL